jgi:uncharacterized protein (DUF983 family)
MVVSALRALVRGSTRRCPHYGRGPLFKRRWRILLYDRCPTCGLTYLRNYGDLWAFLLFIDRVAFIFPLVAALYFRMYELGVLVFGAFAVGVISLLIPTTPNRYGLCFALDYLVRARWPEGNDPLPGPDSSAG